MIGNGGFSGGGGFVSGVTDVFANLPDASSQTNKLYYVTTGSGGLLSIVGSYKYPKGLYFSDGVTWVLSQLQVQIAEDAQSLVNFTDWTTYLANGNVVKQWDVIIYSSKMYQNTTGTTTATAPDLDTTNFTELTFGYLDANFAEWQKIVGTNNQVIGHKLSDSVESKLGTVFLTDPEMATTGNITITAVGFSTIAAASKNIRLGYGHNAKGVGEDWDASPTDINSGDKALNSTQDLLDYISHTVTVASLGWTANEYTRFDFSKINTGVTNNLSGTWTFLYLRITGDKA
jgi:hypothetical protein